MLVGNFKILIFFFNCWCHFGTTSQYSFQEAAYRDHRSQDVIHIPASHPPCLITPNKILLRITSHHARIRVVTRRAAKLTQTHKHQTRLGRDGSLQDFANAAHTHGHAVVTRTRRANLSRNLARAGLTKMPAFTPKIGQNLVQVFYFY